MKNSGMDFSKFKKVKTDEKSSTFRHIEDGHELKIAHSKLNPKLRKQLDEVPHYAEGGEVEEEPSFTQDLERAANTVKDVWNDYQPEDTTPSGEEFASKYNVPANAPPQSTVTETPAPIAEPVVDRAPTSTAPPTLAPAQPAPTDSLGNVAGQYTAGAKAEAKAIGEQGKAEAAIQDEQIAAQQNLIKSFEEKSQSAMNEINSVMEDYKKGHINPNHYMESRTSGQKVMSAIGLILSGFGSGLSGQENMAAKFLDEQIKRDIAAQEKELGKQENLLSFNFKQYGNMADAIQMTSAMQKGLYAAKLEKAASMSKDPIAQARALQAAAKFKAEILPEITKLASSQAAAGILNSGTKTEKDFQSKLNALGAVNPNAQKDLMERYIPGVGVASVKPTDKDKDALSSISQIKKGLTQLQARAATVGTTIPGSAADAENKALVASLQLQMKNAFQLGVLSGSDLEMLEKLTGDPGAFATGKAISRLESTKKSMDALEKGVTQKLGITPFEGGDPLEGRTATDAKGNKIVRQNGKWVPYGR